jgi:hypothetical protein
MDHGRIAAERAGFNNAGGRHSHRAGSRHRVGALVKDVNGTRLIHANGIRVELLLLLHSHYPHAVPQAAILDSLSRQKPASAKAILRKLHGDKFVHGSAKEGYRLTQAGHVEALAEASKLVS